MVFLLLDILATPFIAGWVPTVTIIFDSISTSAGGKEYLGPFSNTLVGIIWFWVIWKMWRVFFRKVAPKFAWMPWWTGIGLLGKTSNKWYKWFPYKKRRSRIWKGVKERGWAPFLLALRQSRLRIVKNRIENLEMKNPQFNNELSYTFTQIRAELMMVMNWMTRLHTYYGKKGGVEDAQAQAAGLQIIFDQTPMSYDELSEVIDTHRFDLGDKKRGWNTNREMITQFFELLKSHLESSELKGKYNEHDDLKIYEGYIKSRFLGIFTAMSKGYSQFEDDIKKFGLIHRLKSLKIHILDLVALYGAYKHYYRFADENAIYELWEVPVNTIDKGDPVVWSIDFEKLKIWKDYPGYKEYAKAVRRKYIEIMKKKQKEFMEDLRKRIESELRTALTEDARRRFTEHALNEIKRRIPNATGIGRAGSPARRWVEERVAEEVNRRLEGEVRGRLKPEFTRLYRTDKKFKRRYKLEVTDAAQLELKSLKVRKQINDELAKINKSFRLGFAIQSFATQFGTVPLRHEVDIKGFVLEDVNAIEVEHKNLGYIRRVRIEDIKDYPQTNEYPNIASFAFVFKQILNEWDAFMQDLRFGHYHPNSRSDVDYTNLISKNTFDLRSRNQNGREYPTRTPPQYPERGAFDLEALRHSGLYKYWGKKNYWDESVSRDRKTGNPYPTLSTVGLSQVLNMMIEKAEKKTDKTRQELAYWVWDSSSKTPEKVFTTGVTTGGEKTK
ncbi:hypothetical protein HYX06_05520 [Candidatus Woesearchaeota archaeon]|nr:hypothetical protein [Candidatus Woesearchaeota archaeon]